ncbi:MAG: hypothetical protein IPK32_17285 [Verrucomicrobiaceae bacterium]|nr:hypothetical protein [Verrucomicrobiaceae bacterium]
MPDGPEDFRRPDAPSTLELALTHTRTGAETIRRSGGIFSTTQLAAESEALRQWAAQSGWLKSFSSLPTSPDAFGYEHEVWFGTGDSRPQCVIKATYGNCFGHLPDGSEASPTGYLHRLILCNEVFGDHILFLGVEEIRPGVIRVVTEQPAVDGKPAEPDEIAYFFKSSGFERRRLGHSVVWYRPEDRIIASDTHGGNVLATEDGAFVAIDVPLMLWQPSMKPLEVI